MILSFMSGLLPKVKQVRDKLYFEIHKGPDTVIEDETLHEKWMFMEKMYNTISDLLFYYERLNSAILEEQNNKQ